MPTLIYAPAIRVHVETEKHGILDISEDISQWEVVRRSNTVSSFNFVLQNTDRKYDGAFMPSDRITVELKRFTWVRVFTGSLNSVPIFSAWPRALPMSASCSLKKLQFWPWDPTTTESAAMVQDFFSNHPTEFSTKGDAGLSGLIKESLVKVTNWDPKAIHIGAVPNGWFKWAQSTEQAIDQASSMAAVLGSGASLAGSSLYQDLKLPKGQYGSIPLAGSQCDLAVQIFTMVATDTNIDTPADQDLAAKYAIACGIAMSALEPDADPRSGTKNVGVYGMSSKWGSIANRKDVAWATRALVDGSAVDRSGLIQVKNWQKVDGETLCSKVLPEIQQFSGVSKSFGSALTAADQVVKALRKQIKKTLKQAAGGSDIFNNNPSVTGGTGGSIPGGGSGDPNAWGIGASLAKVAYDLCYSRPAGSSTLRYGNARGTQAGALTNPTPTMLDCSELVDWVFYNTTHHSWPGDKEASTSGQIPQLTPITLEMSKHIYGALPYRTTNGGHIGVSLGDGTHIAAHGVGLNPEVGRDAITSGPEAFNGAGLAPHIDYTNAATTPEAAKYLTGILKKKCSVSTYKGIPSIPDPNTGTVPGGAQTDANPFDQLISAITAYTPTQGYGDIFGGARQLMNNQPFLPWLTHLTNSTMRAFCSAPNGDFIAWFPDYFDIWGIAARMVIKPIELQDFTVDWSDQQIVTHEFVIGSTNPIFDNSSGGIVQGGSTDLTQWAAMLATNGIATMDFPQIFKVIYGEAADGKFVHDYLTRFGARPNLEQIPNIIRGPQEFYMALWRFMTHWSEQFNATVPMTFMPELWPGMIIQIKEFGFQAYVTQVTHRGSYGDNGRFITEATIIAPAPINRDQRSSLFGVLDILPTQPSKKKSK